MTALFIVIIGLGVFFIKIDEDSEILMSSRKRYAIQASLSQD